MVTAARPGCRWSAVKARDQGQHREQGDKTSPRGWAAGRSTESTGLTPGPAVERTRETGPERVKILN